REQQARIEIAGLRHPGAATAAAARGLKPGDDPERRALARAAEPQRLLVGRTDRVVGDEPSPGRRSRGVELHQNSDFAAAVAALTIGAATKANRRLNRPPAAMMALSVIGVGLKAGAASSKYIVLTIRR